MATVCEPAWYVDSDSVCPFGEHLLFDITAPTNPNFFDGISILYGYLLFAAILLVIIMMLWRRGSREYSLVLFLIAVTLISEYGWKRIVEQPRPVGSCNTTCGMPSSHAVISVALWTILMFDVAYRAYQTEQGYSVSRSFLEKLRSFIRDGHILPTASAISEDQLVVVVSFWSLVLLPIPLSRVILRDHTPQQVFMGGIIGIVEATVWHFITLFARIKTDRYVGARVWKGIFVSCRHSMAAIGHPLLQIHNWPAPRCYIRVLPLSVMRLAMLYELFKMATFAASSLEGAKAAPPVARQPLPFSTTTSSDYHRTRTFVGGDALLSAARRVSSGLSSAASELRAARVTIDWYSLSLRVKIGEIEARAEVGRVVSLTLLTLSMATVWRPPRYIDFDSLCPFGDDRSLSGTHMV
ncbi:hypothetical protein FOZ62_030331 [Perkinsus olseni]|uniref:Phosphatidic acid phosphatase type 2/haloperoxidase domain-containing protein n=1 Tax=Perkinsus olseni TaxID=32597 RepID=A0A7J6QNY5_PEROL|nr:hypothetical protein FOZ62_030331 [Perkinsus olseni]